MDESKRIKSQYKSRKSYRIGEINKNSCGSIMKIIEYKDSCDLFVEFQDEHKSIVHCKYQNFKKGYVKNPFDKKVVNIGCIGNTTTKEYKNKTKASYHTWFEMVRRCYGSQDTRNIKAYSKCSVSDDWLCYENFEKWYNENYWECGSEKMSLDKDILFKGNKTYSKDTCIFVPQSINSLFAGVDFNKESCSTCFVKRDNTYKSFCKNTEGKCDFLGYYKTISDAHSQYIIGKRGVH